jgi:hypothetical protein
MSRRVCLENRKHTNHLEMSETQEKIETPQIQENTKKAVLRQVRTSLVDVFVSLARVLFFWIPGGDIEKGRALMACHPVIIGLCIAMFFAAPPKSPFRFLLAALGLAVVSSQWLLGGCVVTRAEQKLTGGKETILDPFLLLAGVEVNRDTRIAATVASSTAIIAIMTWVLVCDLFKG